MPLCHGRLRKCAIRAPLSRPLLLGLLVLLHSLTACRAVIMDGSTESIQRLLDEFVSATSTLPDSTQQQQAEPADKGAEGQPRSRRPNIVLILTDDQDLLLNSTHPAYMPSMHEYIAKEGLWLRSFAVSSPVCCPSRVNLLTGRYTHNTNVSSNVGPRGGYPKFQEQSLDESYLPTWLQSLGYRTYFTGKFLNGFNPALDKTQRCPAGWTEFEPLVKPYIMHYWDTSFTRNCGPTYIVRNQYTTDVLLNKTLSYILDALQHPDQPFYIHVNPIAPHESCAPRADVSDGDSCNLNPVPATRHAYLYNDVQLPQYDNYGHIPPNGTFNWVDKNTFQRSWKPLKMREIYRARLRAVRAVDEMIAVVVEALKAARVLDNTYVIFMSDNGFKIGNHGVYKGKMTAYEEDVRVPFFIRGPGIGKGLISDYQATMCDVPASILDLAGGVLPPHVDGTPLPLKKLIAYTPMQFDSSVQGAADGNHVQGQSQLAEPRDQIPHEMWVWGSDKRLTGKAYRSVRVCTSYLPFGTSDEYRQAARAAQATFGFRMHSTVSYHTPDEGLDTDTPITCLKYTLWCTGTVELYDLMLDPRETYNRLEAYLSIQGFCKGKDCYAPYALLHGNGSTITFEQAMDPQYDTLYESLPVFRFKRCEKWYYPENEASWLRYSTEDPLQRLPIAGKPDAVAAW